MMLRSTFSLLTAAMLVGVAPASLALTIDDFSDDQLVSIPIGPPTPQTQADPGVPVPIGERELNLTRTEGFGSASADSNLTQEGRFSFSTGPGVVANALLTYVTGGGLDVTDGGASSFLELAARSDLDATLMVSFLSAGGANVSSLELFLPGTGTGAGDPYQFLSAPFADLIGTADLTDVGAIEVAIEGPASLDLQIDVLRTVPQPLPEPGVLALLGLGAGAAALFSRRRA